MTRKIKWLSGLYDNILLVYEKATNDALCMKIMSELEEDALKEAEEYGAILGTSGSTMTSQMFENMPDLKKEEIICGLGEIGLDEFVLVCVEPVISVELSPQAHKVVACTMFNILDRLEVLDGSYNLIFGNITLELGVPLGGRKGLAKYELLLCRLYPWLSVKEIPSDVLAQN